MTLTIQMNGERREVPAGLTLAALLELLELPADRVAVELNREVVKRSAWGSTPIQEGDQLEIVQMVGGGSGNGAGVSRRDLP